MPDFYLDTLTVDTDPDDTDRVVGSKDPAVTPLDRAWAFSTIKTYVADRLVLASYTTAQMNALATPAAGEVIFNTDEGVWFGYDGSDWVSLIDGLPEPP